MAPIAFTRVLVLGACTVSVGAGCAQEVSIPGDHAASTGGASSAAAAGGGGSGGAPPATLRFSGRVVDESNPDYPITDATICVLDRADIPCASTDMQGAFSVFLAAHAETGLSITSTFGAPRLLAVATDATDLDGYTIAVEYEKDTKDYYAFAAAAYPDGGGFLRIDLIGFAKAGLQIAITPASGLGPLYTGPDPLPAADPSLQATSTAGQARFADLDVGVATVTVSPGVGCDNGFGAWPTLDPSKVRVPIRAGFETRAELFCK